MTTFPFILPNGFTPNDAGWSPVGNIDNWAVDATGRQFTFKFGGYSLILVVLGPTAFRLRFNPTPGAVYNYETSVAVVNRDLGLTGLNVAHNQPQPNQLVINTGTLKIQIALTPFAVQVFRGGQLIHQDASPQQNPPGGVLYIPGASVNAVMKTAAPGAYYLGLGEKAGSHLLKNNFTFTFFNFDNYTYNIGPCLGDGGPLNPTEPLYCSIPLLIEYNPFPQAGGPFAGTAYACGMFLDNTAQTFANISANDYSNMDGKYYMGSIYNELDYYFFAGEDVRDILAQYTTLTGRSSMPPRYVFGLHQGAYGYFNEAKLQAAADGYRNFQIPCDGLHIDVDFQNNYRTFTHSNVKFPNVANFFQNLHANGFKMSTNITPIITSNQLDENGNKTPYVEQQNLVAANALIYNTRFDSGEDPNLYEAGVNYGFNRGNNPYPYPPLQPNSQGLTPLKAPGNYPDFGLAAVRAVWGQQYSDLLLNVKLDMIWQDMTCPAIDSTLPPDIEAYNTFAQDLMMAQEQTQANGTVTVVYKPNCMLHNSYVLNLLTATWGGITALVPVTRNFIIARGGYAGMQRYAALWTGDSASSWDFLQINLPEVLNLGLSGVPISGCDIGGFATGSATTSTSYVDNGQITGGITNYELLTRWMQLGSFLPWYRNHYDGYNKQFQEPFAYGEPVPTNCRKYVGLRYRMMQVYYDAMYQWTQTGLPIARALFLNDPSDQQVYQHLNDEFFVGDDFLVAPMLNQYETANPPQPPTRSIYLPNGSNWYAFMDNSSPLAGAVSGGTYLTYFADLSLVPIYVRAGAILPFGNLEQWVGQLPANSLTINCYPGPDRWTDAEAYQLYQDDGITTAANAGTYRLTLIYQQTLTQGQQVTRQIRMARQHDQYAPASAFNYIALLGSINSASQVTRDGVVLQNVGDPDSLARFDGDAWYYNQSVQIVFVKLKDNIANTTLSVTY
jgi:alpha-glucosidase